MAQITKLVDDLNGRDAEMTLSFGLDGKEYEIDLCDENYETYRQTLEKLASVARVVVREPVKVKRTLSTGKKTSVVGKTQEMREWLRANGHNVSDRGRVPTHLVDLYETRPRGPQTVLGEDDMRDVVKSLKSDDTASETPETPDEDIKAEQAVIARVKSTPKTAPTTRRKSPAKNKGVEVEIPALREVLSLVDGGK